MEKKRAKSGWIGLLMLAIGAKLFFNTESGYVPLWVAWLVGPILWYGGFLFVCFWFLNRILYPIQTRSAAEKQRGAEAVLDAPAKAMSAKAGAHDSRYEIVRPGVNYRKLALIGATLGLLVMLSVSARAVDPAAEGQSLFKAKCAMCHGPNADGKTAMGTKFGIRDMHSADVQKQSDAELKAIITKGKEKMPSYDGKLSPEQLTDLISYIRQVGKK
jgi:mono/diheme cytochrome c family protein